MKERDRNNQPLTTYTRGIDLLAAPESGVGGSETLQGLPHERKRQKWSFKAQANSSELQPLASFQSLAGERGIGGLLARSDNQKNVPAILTPPSPNPQNVVTSYYFNDDQGNVTALVSPAGMLLAQYEYDPFGNLISKSGLMAEMNKFRFSSKEWDDNADLYYYGFRFFDPNLQRWLNRDPIQEMGGVDLYEFVANDPLNEIDPSGLYTLGEWGQIVGAGWGSWSDSANSIGQSLGSSLAWAYDSANGNSALAEGDLGSLADAYNNSVLGQTRCGPGWAKWGTRGALGVATAATAAATAVIALESAGVIETTPQANNVIRVISRPLRRGIRLDKPHHGKWYHIQYWKW